MKTTSISKDDVGRAQRGARDVDTDSLLQRYRRAPTVKTRNELIERHRQHVEAIAHLLAARLPRSVDVQDLVHAGVWGLMQAIETFDPQRGIPFPQFMQRRARGAMLDELRNLDYLPRLYRQINREREAATQALRARLRRDPSDAEIAAEIGVSETRMRRVATQVEPLEHEPTAATERGEASNGAIDSLADEGVEHPLEALNRQDLLAKIEASLAAVEWRVMKLHYFEGLPGKEIARRLRLSESRICQIHGRVLSRLKLTLRALGPGAE